jgi:hypothetical protein
MSTPVVLLAGETWGVFSGGTSGPARPRCAVDAPHRCGVPITVE